MKQCLIYVDFLSFDSIHPNSINARQLIPPITTFLFPKSYTPLVGINDNIPPIRNPIINTLIVNNLNLLFSCD